MTFEFDVILLTWMLIHINCHRIILDRWTCNLAYHVLFIKTFFYKNNALYQKEIICHTQCVKILGKLPRTWVNQAPYNISFNVNDISCSINYSGCISHISTGLSQRTCQHKDCGFMLQQTSYTEILKSLAFEEDQTLGCKWFPSPVLYEPISKPAEIKRKTSADFSGHWIHVTFSK